eukprot:scaffold39048_cov70-Phaeocystis_antarctica.AAC.5
MLLAAGEAPVHVAHVTGDGPTAAVGGPTEPNKGPCGAWLGAGSLRCRQRLELRAVIGAARPNQQLEEAHPGIRIARTTDDTYLINQVPVEGRLALQLEQRAQLPSVRRVLSPVHACARIVLETGAAEDRVSAELFRAPACAVFRGSAPNSELRGSILRQRTRHSDARHEECAVPERVGGHSSPPQHRLLRSKQSKQSAVTR